MSLTISTHRASFTFTVICWLMVTAGLFGCAASSNTASSNKVDREAALESQWGIRLMGIRLSAVGHLLDFRYQVTDPIKAEGLMRRGSEAFLIDEATGQQMPVPVSKVGQLRGTGTKPQAGRVYAVLFTNNRKTVKKGDVVTVVIADFRAEHLVVE